MPRPDAAPTRRLELTLRRPPLALHAGVRPTVVIGARAQPAQWGTGTWLVAADEPVDVAVFLFNRLWRFGAAAHTLPPGADPVLRYVAPVLPFMRGRLLAG